LSGALRQTTSGRSEHHLWKINFPSAMSLTRTPLYPKLEKYLQRFLILSMPIYENR